MVRVVEKGAILHGEHQRVFAHPFYRTLMVRREYPSGRNLLVIKETIGGFGIRPFFTGLVEWRVRVLS
jgi:hypothetical protein